MRITKVQVGAAHKFNLPGLYETINPILILEAEVTEREDPETCISQLKQELDRIYPKQVAVDYQEAFRRNSLTTPGWLQEKCKP
jgi:hypothetical protein